MTITSTTITRDFEDHDTPQSLPLPDFEDIRDSEHFVQFYDEDSFLIRSVASYLMTGFSRRNIGIVIATEAHRTLLALELEKEGFDADKLRNSGLYLPFDAAETMSKFMVGNSPDSRLFMEVVGDVVGRAAKSGRSIRAFGEMVALLWAEGNQTAAIKLEELWNDLAEKFSFALFCAYPMKGLCGSENGEPFAHVCKAHSQVIPAESYARQSRTEDEKLRTISFLQQKALSLEAEIVMRKASECALAERERELADFLENAVEAIHKVGPDGKILWANAAELELLGFTKDEYIGRHISEFHTDPHVIADILSRLERGEKLRNYEARLRCKDGTIRYVSINSSVSFKKDRFSHTKCFTRDITEAKRASEILEKTVVERTAKLTEALTELEAFSYSISHDLRSPLRAMYGYAESLVQDYGSKFEPEAVSRLERIARAARRLDLLVRDVLAYSKVSKGDIELRPVALGPLAEDIVNDWPGLEGVRGCVALHPLPVVRGHEAYLTQCLTNLIENAVKFVVPGTRPKVIVRSEIVDSQAKIIVSDNGIGIRADHGERLFRIFGRVHSEKQYQGTGIGLALVKRAVTRMGGQIGFQSEVGKGSDFWIMLPHAN